MSDGVNHPDAMRLRTDVLAAIDARRKYTDESRVVIQQYMGRGYRGEQDDAEDGDPQFNHAFEFVANFVPSLVMHNPTVEVTSDGMDTPESEAIQDGLQGLIPKINLARTLSEVAHDVAFDFGVVCVTLEPTPGLPAQPDPVTGEVVTPMRPTAKRISPRMFFIDPRCTGVETPAYVGHAWIRRKADLLAERDENGEPVYDADAVEAIGPEVGTDEAWNDLIADISGDDEIDRDEVVGFEVYMPSTGYIYCLSYNGVDAKWLRPPRRYGGPKDGPYVVFGIYTVPDQPYPLSPLAVTRELSAALNRYADQAEAEALAAKRIAVTDAANPIAVDLVRKSRTGSVVAIPGFVPNMLAQIDLGGSSAATLEYITALAARLDRTSGLTEIIRGNVNSSTTATAVATASQAADIRVKHAQAMFRRCVVEVLKRLGQMMYTTPGVIFPVTKTDPDTSEQQRMLFVGGTLPGQSESAFELMQFEIEPYSMQYVDSEILQKRMQDVLQLVLGNAPMLPQLSAIVNLRPLFDDVFKAINQKSGSSRYFNWNNIAAISQLPMPGVNAPNAPMPSSQVQPSPIGSDGGARGPGASLQARALMNAGLGGAMPTSTRAA